MKLYKKDINTTNNVDKRKEKRSKKEKKNDTSKDKILGVRTRYAPSILSLLERKTSATFL